MTFTFTTLAIALSLGTGHADPPQQGGGQGIFQNDAVQSGERALSQYLNGEQLKSILTPGETVDYPIDLKPGQVLVADAVSESFDPALEIVDEAGKVQSMNDDRYPGDQRPLLFWRCEKLGGYTLRVRSFQNKAGGEVRLRHKVYDTLDLSKNEMTEGIFDATKPFFVRVPMKAGQVKVFVSEKEGEGNYLRYQFNQVINPNGLPERAPSLAEGLAPAIGALVAPLAGEYYLMYSPYGSGNGTGRVRIMPREVVPIRLDREGTQLVGSAPTNFPALFEVTVKKGELLEAKTPDLDLSSLMRISEAPDFSGFALDPKKPELNPFFPRLRNMPPGEGPAFDFMPARHRDGRVAIFHARRDAKLWIASNSAGPKGKQFSLVVRPAAAAFGVDKPQAGNLRIGNHDYWSFDAKAGDVMSFKSTAQAFSQVVVVRDPDLGELRHVDVELDQVSDAWRMVIQKPGPYLVQIACLGDGGGGAYTLSRSVLSASEFTTKVPAKGELADGQIQIWKFTAVPNEPLFVHWTSSHWGYDVSIYDDKGNPADFQRQDIDGRNKLGILKVAEPRTYVIVLSGKGEKATYSIELNRIPGETGKH